MGCTNCNDTPCQEKDCSCKVFISSDCVNNVKAVFNCLNIETGLDLTQTLEAMDEALCERFESITNYFTLINTGEGAEVYKGVNLLGQKEIRKIKALGDLVTVTQNTLDISISIDEEELITFIQDNQLTTVVENAGDGAEILKTPVTVGNETTYSLKSLKAENLGSGEGVFESIQENINDVTFRFKRLKSNNTLIITSDEEYVYIEQPELTDIPRFIVNSAYTGTEELGTLSKPFKTIQAAITAFIGDTGTAQSPENEGAEIIIQKGVGYTFTGSFALNSCTIILEEGTFISSDPSSGDWLCDYDTLSTTEPASLKIVLKENSLLVLTKNGFRNKGTSVDNGSYSQAKLINIKGTGKILQNTVDVVNTPYTVFEANYTTNDDFKNDSAPTMTVEGVTISSLTQKIYKNGGNSVLIFNDVNFESGNPNQVVNTSLKCFDQIGGQVRKTSCEISTPTITRDVLYSSSKSATVICQLFMVDCVFNVINVDTIFQNETNLQSTVNIKACKSLLSNIINIAKSPNTKWLDFKSFDSILEGGDIDPNEVDLTANNTISASNTFSNRLVESLPIFSSRAAATTAGLKPGNAFINRKTVVAGNFIIGEEYTILSVGTSDFTLIGASANTIGVVFTATGAGTGNGTAYNYRRDVVL